MTLQKSVQHWVPLPLRREDKTERCSFFSKPIGVGASCGRRGTFILIVGKKSRKPRTPFVRFALAVVVLEVILKSYNFPNHRSDRSLRPYLFPSLPAFRQIFVQGRKQISPQQQIVWPWRSPDPGPDPEQTGELHAHGDALANRPVKTNFSTH